jgi:hypothetical protein
MVQRLIFVTLLVLTIAPAYGEWMLVDRSDQLGMSLYVDSDTIHRRGEVVDMWALYDYKDLQTRMSGDSYSSRKVRSEYNCTEKVKRLMDVEEYSGQMGNGKVVHKQSNLLSIEHARWTPIHPGGGEILWNIACKKY